MLFTLGLGSAVSLAGGVVTVICDALPQAKRWIVTSIVCIAGFLAGLIYVTPVSWLFSTLPKGSLILFKFHRAVCSYWTLSIISPADLSCSSFPLLELWAFAGSTVRIHSIKVTGTGAWPCLLIYRPQPLRQRYRVHVEFATERLLEDYLGLRYSH